MNIPPHLDKAHDHLTAVTAVTVGSAASSIVIWGLRLSDWAAIVSACVALCGLGVQIWVARTKVRLMNKRLGDKKWRRRN